MAKKKQLTPESTALCIGSMSFRIDIQKRVVSYTSGQSTYSFTTAWTVWAAKKTTDGLQKFSGININDVPDTIWLIRTISTLTSEYWIKHNSLYYRIIKVETVNGGSHQKVYCRETGSSSLDGSKS